MFTDANQEEFVKLSQQRNFEMLANKVSYLHRAVEKLQVTLESRVSQSEFIDYIQKAAREFATTQFLDLSIQQLEMRHEQRRVLTPQKVSKYIQKNDYTAATADESDYGRAQQAEANLEQWKQRVVAQLREMFASEQKEDKLRTFREQISNSVSLCNQKLQTLEERQVAMRRFVEQNETAKLRVLLSEVEERVQNLECGSQGVQEKLTQFIEMRKEQKLKKKKLMEQQQQQNSAQNVTSQLQSEMMNNMLVHVQKTYFTKAQGAELLLRINQSEDAIKTLLTRELFDNLQNDITSLKLQMKEQQQLLIQNLRQLNERLVRELNYLSETIRVKVDKGELLELLDNPSYTMKVNSQIQQLQEKYKELYRQQIDLIETKIRFELKNIQSAAVSEQEQINQSNMMLKQCENLRTALADYFGMKDSAKGVEKSIESTTIRTKSSRPQSVYVSRRPKLRLNSATPQAAGSQTSKSFTFSSSQAEPLYLQRVLQNPLVKNLKK